ncbi:MAG: hypothetical protein LBM01_02245 [Christensenellaceae bacterium]|jgi:hypothetical protein|nr:hypothetical protein [Christensenellaceae bacterium]
MEYIAYLPLGLLGLMVLFLLVGVLFGLGRGLHRAWLRLLTIVFFATIIFFLTPNISKAILHIPFIENFLIDMAGGFIEIDPTSSTYNMVLSLVMAFGNVFVWIIFLIIANILSWIVYAILARIFMPKKNKITKEKNPKHSGFGALIGLATGFVLFFLFMIPFNGLIYVAESLKFDTDKDSYTVEYKQDGENVKIEYGKDELSASALEQLSSISKFAAGLGDGFRNGSAFGIPAGKIYGAIGYAPLGAISGAACDYLSTVYYTDTKTDETVKFSLTGTIGDFMSLADNATIVYARISNLEGADMWEKIGALAGDDETAIKDRKAINLVKDQFFDLKLMTELDGSAEIYGFLQDQLRGSNFPLGDTLEETDKIIDAIGPGLIGDIKAVLGTLIDKGPAIATKVKDIMDSLNAETSEEGEEGLGFIEIFSKIEAEDAANIADVLHSVIYNIEPLKQYAINYSEKLDDMFPRKDPIVIELPEVNISKEELAELLAGIGITIEVPELESGESITIPDINSMVLDLCDELFPWVNDSDHSLGKTIAAAPEVWAEALSGFITTAQDFLDLLKQVPEGLMPEL